jgi:uncharacterized membrane protein YoaK (UPF0700 family)
MKNALVQISSSGAPSTAVMTTNLTQFVINPGQVLLGRNLADGQRAAERASLAGPVIAGFLLGCILGAAGEATFGMRSLVVPATFALAALVLGTRIKQSAP